MAKQNKSIVGITPAMPTGSSLKYMMEVFPNRAFDVGIAEQHAVTMAAGMTTQGLMPFCNIYSTFLQRAYDQIIHDVALQNLPVIFCVDRAGLVGEDGATHHGVFDLAYLRCIPNLIIVAPRNEKELRNIMYTAQNGLKYPIAIRYPRGRGETLDWKSDFETIEIGTGVQLEQGKNLAILSVGAISNTVSNAIDGLNCAHYDMRFIKPLDEPLLHSIFKAYPKIITIEDGVIRGGFGTAVLEFAATHHYKNDVFVKGIPDDFIDHGAVDTLFESLELDAKGLKHYIKSKS